MAMTTAGRTDGALGPRRAWALLLVLTTAFMLSQAFRTTAAIMAAPLAAEFGLSADALGLFAAAFHFAFGALQLLMGVGIDLHGLRRTVLVAFPLAIAGSVLCANAPGFGWLLLGQALIGIGSAPTFLVCTVFIARHFPAERFAALSGAAIGIGGVGMLLTGTPMAWLIDTVSWRAGFWALGGAGVLAWLAIARWVHEPMQPAAMAAAPRESMAEAWRGVATILRLPHTIGIVLMGLVSYASFVALRGLWLGPMLIDRHGFTLVESGNVALAMSAVSLVGAPLFGRLDPGPARRRRWIVVASLASAVMFATLALSRSASLDVLVSIAFGLVSGYMVLQCPT